MNIISNNCIGGYIYTETKTMYNNPFMWTNILTPEFVNLVNSYNNIDFLNYNITYEHTGWNDNGDLPKNTLVTTVHIDNLVDVYYTHHLYYSKYDTIHKLTNGNRLLSNNMKDFVDEKYNSRIQRMIKVNEPPIFIYLEWDYEKESDILLENKTDNIIIISAKYKTEIMPKMEIYNFNDICPNIKHITPLYGAKWLIKNSKMLNIHKKEENYNFVKL